LPFVRVRLTARKPKDFSDDPKTLGEHIRKRRIERGLTLKQAAAHLGVTDYTVINWEYDRTDPPITCVPAFISFLGYDPYPEPTTVGERLLAKRREKGWTIKRAARAAGIDPGTWRDWEAGKVILFRKHRTVIATLLGIDLADLDADMQGRWAASHEARTSPHVTISAPWRETGQ
jgi:transcriptional regulator with XRE-family HTH domain